MILFLARWVPRPVLLLVMMLATIVGVVSTFLSFARKLDPLMFAVGMSGVGYLLGRSLELIL